MLFEISVTGYALGMVHILFQKLFWPTMSKKCSINWENKIHPVRIKNARQRDYVFIKNSE